MIWRCAIAIGWMGVLCFGEARADTLSTLLAGVTNAAKLSTPLRADADMESDGVAGRQQDHLVLIEQSDAEGGAQAYLELEKAKVRLLLLGPNDLHLATASKVDKVGPGASVGTTNFFAEDFLPFSPSRCGVTRIADLTDEQFTIVCEPRKPTSQYALMVFKFDREKSVLLQVLLYKDSATNLVKMLRNDEFVKVGSAWRPKRVVLQDFKLRTKDTLALEWAAAVTVPPEAFDPKTFASAAVTGSARTP